MTTELDNGTDVLMTALRRARLRLSLQRWIMLSVYGFFVGSVLSCVWLVLTRFFVVLGDALPVTLALMCVGWLVGSLIAYRRRPSLIHAALELDRCLGLKERLTSSYELHDVEGEMVEAVHRDAHAHIEGLDFNKQFPLSSTRKLRWVYVPILIFALGYIFLPEFDILNYKERVAEAKAKEDAIRITAERIKAAVCPLQKPMTEKSGELSDITAKVDKIAKDLQDKSITEKQALARLTNVAQELKKHTDLLRQNNPVPKVLDNRISKLGLTRELANDIQKGRFGAASKKMRELREKLEKGGLSETETKKLQKDLDELSKMMGNMDSELNDALAKALSDAANSMSASDISKALEALENAELTLADLESIEAQLKQMDGAWGKLCQATCDKWGTCASLYKGWAPGNIARMGPGMGGAGRGRGNSVGELPEADVDYSPTVLKGKITKGKILASIIQKAAPEAGEVPTVEYISGAFEQVKQEAEQALTREEIPDGSREFVRQYFGALEPDS